MRDTPTITDPEEQRAIARIEQALSSLGSEYSPPAGWEERVLVAAEAEEKRRKEVAAPVPDQPAWLRRLRWGLPAMGALAAAAAVVLAIWSPKPMPKPEPPSMKIAINDVPSDHVTLGGGSDCRIGRKYRAEGQGSGSYQQLRLYRDKSLAFICEPGKPDATVVLASASLDAPSCEASKGRLTITWTAHASRYDVVGISSNKPIPALQNDSDKDQAALEDAKINYDSQKQGCS